METFTILGWALAAYCAVEWWSARSLLKLEKDFAQSMKRHALEALDREKGLIDRMQSFRQAVMREAFGSWAPPQRKRAEEKPN
jgi:hypothetical protein